MVSQQLGVEFKEERIMAERKLVMLDMGIQVIDLFQTVAEATDSLLPNPLGMVLERVTGILGVLRKMIENRENWKDLISVIDEHQQVFNDQLRRMKVNDLLPDPESPLLAPMIQYSDTLEKLAVRVLAESGLKDRNAENSPAWERIKRFCSRFVFSELESQTIEDFTKELSKAMDHFKLTLEIFVSFTVNSIKGDVEAITSGLRLLGEDVRQVHAILAISSEPKPATSSRNITAFGAQHRICLQGTRIDVLEEIRVWARAKESSNPVYCIGDVAGTGKSTVARTMLNEWQTREPNPFVFFFSQENASVQTASDFCFFIKDQIQALGHGLELDEYWKKLTPTLVILRSQSVHQQWSKLVYEPLTLLPKSQLQILVVDALDECSVETRGDLLECILEVCSSLTHLRVFITTRNEPDILKLLRQERFSGLIQHKALHNSSNAKSDVAFYVNYRLDESSVFLSAPEQRLVLIERCEGLFMFAFLACKLLEDACGDNEPLNEILHEFNSLDVLYHQTLSRADRNPKYTREILKNILGVITVAREPLSISAIASLLPTPINAPEVEAIIRRLSSILGSGGVDEPVYILHTTFTEFLVRQTWVTAGQTNATNEYAVSRAICNRNMARRCLSIMLSELKEGSTNKATAALRYAVAFWIAHAIRELHDSDICDSIRHFFRQKLLNWIEFGAHDKKLAQYMLGVGHLQLALEKLREVLGVAINDDDLKWCRDTLQFLRLNQAFLITVPREIYSSCLAFAPLHNLVHKEYSRGYQDSLPTVMMGTIAPSSQTLVMTGHTGRVDRLAYSPTGNLLVSAAMGGEIMIWDMQTGARLMSTQLHGYLGACLAVGLPPDNQTILSIWDDPGEPTRLYRHNRDSGTQLNPHQILSGAGDVPFAWAPDWTYCVCAPENGFLGRFSLDTGKAVTPWPKAHDFQITCLSFSSEGHTLATTSRDCEIKIWTVTPDKFIGPTKVWKHDSEIRFGAFSPISPNLFAFVDRKSLHVYNLLTQSIEFRRTKLIANSLAYSPDGQHIAIEGRDHVTLLTGVPAAAEVKDSKIDPGHGGRILGLAFSADSTHLTTAGDDCAIHINDMKAMVARDAVKSHRHPITALSISLDGMRVASLDQARYLGIWDVKQGGLMGDPVRAVTMDLRMTAIASDGLTIAYGSRTDDVKFRSVDSFTQIAGKVSLAPTYTEPLDIQGMSFSPDNCILSVIATTPSRYELIRLDLRLINQPDWCISRVELDFRPIGTVLAHHPGGHYLCFGEHAWDIRIHPARLVTGDTLKAILNETFPISIGLADNDNNPPHPSSSRRKPPGISSVLVGNPPRQVFSIPKELNLSSHATLDSLVALGRADGRVVLLDVAPLLTPEEAVFFDRIREIRQQTALRVGPSLLHEIWSTLRLGGRW